jgi:MYXO-CTERM domain-containing protein
MRHLRPGLMALALAAAPGAARAASSSYYVAPTGSDSAAGTMAAPWATIAHAQATATAGDTIYLRGGLYKYTAGTASCKSATDTINAIALNKSGASGSPIRYWAYPGETPVFDFYDIKDSCRVTGFRVTGSWLHLKGLEVRGVPQNNMANHESWGVWNSGSNNVFESLDLHHNMGPGLFIQNGSNNLVLNCDSHHNYDPMTSNGAGQSADGFGCHVSASNPGNVFRGCRAWWNSDDGWDFINAFSVCTVENSWTWYNGYLPDTMTAAPAGNGNGFKGGGYGTDTSTFPASPPQHVVRGCLAVGNRASGFYANHHPGPITFYNNTSYNNHPDFNLLGMDRNGADIHVGVLRNNLAFGGTLVSNDSGTDEANNSWTLSSVSVSAADFQSTAVTGLDGPRQADGSLPVLPNFRLAPGSDLIDKGVVVGLPYAGAAPDLGAFEDGAVSSGSGGAGGAGGARGTAGAAGGTSGAPGAGGAGAGAAGRGGMAGAPSPGGASGTSGPGGAGDARGGSDGPGGRPGTGGVAAEAGASGRGGASDRGGATGTAGASPPTGGAGPAPATDEGGCSCDAAGAPSPIAAVGLALLALASIRRRDRREGATRPNAGRTQPRSNAARDEEDRRDL